MALREDEIDLIIDEAMPGRGIVSALFCATCGYNLRGLPHRGVCPECGKRYNARSRRMHGIFLPHELEFPFSDIFASVFALALTGVLIAALFLPLALVFGVLSVLSIRMTYRRLRRFMHFYRIMRRIEAEEE